jgi:uncharacterized protein involved in response to NO
MQSQAAATTFGAMTAIPRYRPHAGPAVLSAGFRPFFLGAAFWSAFAIPLWLLVYSGHQPLPSGLDPLIWHAHEMVFGFAAATVAGFMLTAIPNWTGRLPLQGGPLLLLVALWSLGRLGVLFSQRIGPGAAAILDLSFPLLFLLTVAREIVAGRNWRNLPMVGALSLLFAANLLVHLGALGIAATGQLGNRIGIATLLLLISLVGGRIIPSFTRNWLARQRADTAMPAVFGNFDRAALAATALALALWAALPESMATAAAALVAGVLQAARLLRWQGVRTWHDPLVLILHLGYGWLALGLLLLGVDFFLPVLPPTAALHALTAGAIGTMTLAVMSRASLGHTGRPLAAGPGTCAVYILVTLAALLRVPAPLGGGDYLVLLSLSGGAWSAAFGLFFLLYLGPLTAPRTQGEAARPI